jgi:hypothetical protein
VVAISTFQFLLFQELFQTICKCLVSSNIQFQLVEQWWQRRLCPTFLTPTRQTIIKNTRFMAVHMHACVCVCVKPTTMDGI